MDEQQPPQIEINEYTSLFLEVDPTLNDHFSASQLLAVAEVYVSSLRKVADDEIVAHQVGGL